VQVSKCAFFKYTNHIILLTKQKELCLIWISRRNKPARSVGKRQNFVNVKTCDSGPVAQSI